MGAQASRVHTTAVFDRVSGWDLPTASRVLQDYKNQDLDFGLDAHGLSLILEGDKEFADKVIPAFGSTNGLINVLAFISGATLIARGSIKEKAELVFDAFDFDGTNAISMDEMTILFLCALRGLVVMTNTGTEPQDDLMETITIQAYGDYGKNNSDMISKEHFVSWILKFVGEDETLSSTDLLTKFGLYEPKEINVEETETRETEITTQEDESSTSLEDESSKVDE